MILVFDLDDTLYDESTYVHSGLRAVSEVLSPILNCTDKRLYDRLAFIIKRDGRGKVFDVLLDEYGVFSTSLRDLCIKTYRYHKPNIRWYDDALRCFSRFEDTTKYIVTDGHLHVQRSKLRSLNAHNYVKKAIPTYQYGRDKSKPSPYVFQKIMTWEKTIPQNICYVGDNPNKDFVNIKREGFRTVRIRRGMFKEVTLGEGYEAHKTIYTLDELTPDLVSAITP